MPQQDARVFAEPEVSAPTRASASTRVGARPYAFVLTAARRLGVWNIRLFCAALALYMVVDFLVARKLSLAGDEPWYLMQGYALVHYHTPSLTAVLQDKGVLSQFDYNYPPGARVRDYLGNGDQLLPYLPGYAAIIGVCYFLTGRLGILWLQGICSALIVALLFSEGRRLFGSSRAGLFACAAFTFSLPALLFTAQVSPSAIASSVAFGGFVLAGRLPSLLKDARALRPSLAIAGLVGAGMLLPWLHFKYVFLSPALVVIALLGLRPLLHWRSASLAEQRARKAALALVGSMILSFLLISVYCHHYFGTWTPPVVSAEGAPITPNLAHPNLQWLTLLFTNMFLNRYTGLLPWVPLDLLVIHGVVALWSFSPPHARDLLICLAGALGGFLSAVYTTDIYQGYAFPARFTVECAPFFALAVAGVFAISEPALRRIGRTWLRRGYVAAAPLGYDGKDFARIALLVTILILFVSGVWFDIFGVRYPYSLFPIASHLRILAQHPHALPGWWFALFPGP